MLRNTTPPGSSLTAKNTVEVWKSIWYRARHQFSRTSDATEHNFKTSLPLISSQRGVQGPSTYVHQIFEGGGNKYCGISAEEEKVYFGHKATWEDNSCREFRCFLQHHQSRRDCWNTKEKHFSQTWFPPILLSLQLLHETLLILQQKRIQIIRAFVVERQHRVETDRIIATMWFYTAAATDERRFCCSSSFSYMLGALFFFLMFYSLSSSWVHLQLDTYSFSVPGRSRWNSHVDFYFQV